MSKKVIKMESRMNKIVLEIDFDRSAEEISKEFLETIKGVLPVGLGSFLNNDESSLREKAVDVYMATMKIIPISSDSSKVVLEMKGEIPPDVGGNKNDLFVMRLTIWKLYNALFTQFF